MMSKCLLKVVLLLSLLFSNSAFSLEVELYQPSAQANAETIVLTGTVESSQTAKVAIQQSGLVAKLFVESGDSVKQGQPLIELDNTLANLLLSQVAADLEATKVEIQEANRLYNEAKALAAEKLIAKSIISERRAALATAKSSLAKKEAELALQKEVVARHTLYAPFSGIVATRNINVGEWVTPQSDVLTLVDTATLRIPLAIPQEYYAFFSREGAIAAQLQFDDASGLKLQSTVSRVVPFARSNSRTFVAYVDLNNQQPLIAGMSAQVTLTLPSQQSELIWLPKSAIKQHPDGGASVFAAVDGKAKRYLVEVIKSRGNQVAVTGAPADINYVTTGVELLAEGQVLTVTSVKGQE